MPCLLLRGSGIVKTIGFSRPVYLGDPRNAVRIYNEREVDELILLDITATVENRPPQFDLLREIVSEAFMPVAIGGGIRSVADACRILSAGAEKVIINSAAMANPALVSAIAREAGSQSVVVCLDVKRSRSGVPELRSHAALRRAGMLPVDGARRFEEAGAGELIVQSVDRDGTLCGYDLPLLREISQSVTVPVVACGGAESLSGFRRAVVEGGAAALAAGSLFVYHGKLRGILINYPDRADLEVAFGA